MANPSITPLRPQPLWVRVDQNRFKLAAFVVAFVGGSAVLLTLALVGVPGALIGAAGVATEAIEPSAYLRGYALSGAGMFAFLLAAGALAAAVQLANAEDWVRNRFVGTDMSPGAYPSIEGAVHDMALAAGLPATPRLVVFDEPSVNACAIGTNRSRASIGITRGFAEQLTTDEQRAVVATLIARITSGDILFATALAALMGPLKAIRESRHSAGKAAGCALDGCANAAVVDDGCGCLSDIAGDDDSAAGCLGAIGVAIFLAVVAAITYAAVIGAAWIVTVWGRILHRTAYEKADAEGMLLLKDPGPMLSALGKSIRSDTSVGDGDPSYDGIFYTTTSGTPAIERVEQRRFQRLTEVLGADGGTARLGGTD